MQIQVEALTMFPRAPKAANEEFVTVDRVQEQAVVSGWDAYEVWRTRIKAVQTAPRTSRSG